MKKEIKSAAALAHELVDRAKKKREEAEQMELAFLPHWDDNRRAMPNVYARSAIFTVRNKKVPRASIQEKPIYVVGDGEITYTGIELRAYDDELVWLQIINMAKARPLGEWIEFTYYEICKALDWPNSARYYESVHACLLRLKATAVAFANNASGSGKAVSFIQEYEWQDADGHNLPRCRIKIQKTMQTLFSGNKFTELEWRAYRELKPLARRLYDYAAAHRNPFPLKLDTFKQMCASDSKILRRWRQQVIEACQEVIAARLVYCWVEDDKIFFDRQKLLT